jgi:hypothetical protein
MLRTSLAATVLSLCISGAAVAAPPTPAVGGQTNTQEQTAKLGEGLGVLQAVGSWSTNLSEMASTRAKSDLKMSQIDIAPLDPKTESGKSLVDRKKAEAAMLGSLEGDAFDKEYMTLVTNTQQSVIHVLHKQKSLATNPQVKQFLGDMETMVQGRLRKAQDVMAKVYGDTI